MLVNKQELKNLFAEHLRQHLGYSESEITIAISDFPDPYANDYLSETYLCEGMIDGQLCEVCADEVSFLGFGHSDDVPPFRFYSYIKESDIPNHLVVEYRSAPRMYSVDNIDPDDF